MSATDFIPEFVPDHLRGQVSDFQVEPDGQVSFAHPRAGLGLSDSRVKLPVEQLRQTFDRDARMRDFSSSLRGQYNPDVPQDSLGNTISQSIGGGLRRAFDWGTSESGRAVGTAGLLSLLAGGVGGYALGRRGEHESPVKTALIGALLAGALGAGVSAYGQNKMQRRNAFLAQGDAMYKSGSLEVTAALIRAVNNDQTLRAQEKVELLRAMTRLREREKDELYRSIRVAIGAGAGLLISRFLRAKGLLPALVGGILGAGIAAATAPSRLKRTPDGQLSTLSYR
jgi:hypothetical protein